MSVDYNTLNTKNHSAYRIFYHIVLSVKYRHKCITADILVRLEEIFRDLLTKWDSRLVEFGGESDHVHLLIETCPTVAPANLIKNMKSVSSRRIRAEYVEHLKPFFWKPYFWSRSYCCISVGGRANIETLLRYIQNQDEPGRLKQPAPLTSDSSCRTES
ncbi:MULTISPECIES: IS200/IS605 family transposase [unclassified Spirulina]|uniref:IS200/IS605 family transposase n=1 Tax=unclassified Spirulina TaxID=2684457 RepID=UPI0019511DCA|nr:IS200/IS605 family transposase [Spirulina sp. 06S082]MEA5468566.1 IS200/IS605 family transposase [Spirulina sp. 06S082]